MIREARSDDKERTNEILAKEAPALRTIHPPQPCSMGPTSPCWAACGVIPGTGGTGGTWGNVP